MDVSLIKSRMIKLEGLVYLILFVGMLRFGFMIRNHSGDPLRNYYFFAGLSFFLTAVLIKKRVKIITGINIVFVAVICGIGCWRFAFWYRCGSPHMYRAVFALTVSCCIFTVLVISFIRKKEYELWKSINIHYAILLLVALMVLTLTGAFNKGIRYIFVLLLVLLFCMPQYSDYKFFFTPFCHAYILVVLNMIIAIYVTEGRFVHQGLGKYSEALPPAVGTFFSGAVVAVLALFINEFLDKRRKIVCAAYLIILIPIIFGISVCGSRIALGGVIFFILYVYFYLLAFYKKKKAVKISAIVVITLLVSVIVGLIFLAKVSPKIIDSVFKNSYLNSKIHYWNARIYMTLYASETKVILPAGSFWNSMDYFFSDRISIWKTYLSDMNLWGHESLGVALTDDYYVTHPHNDYIAWTYWYGIVPGGLLIAWFIYALVKANKLFLRKPRLGGMIFLYACHIAIIQITDTSFFFRDFTFMILMLLQYPLLFDFDKHCMKE